MANLGQELGAFLIGTLFSLYIILVMVRLLLAMVRADFYNPLSQAVVKLTNPPLLPLRRVIPPIGKLDTAAVVLLLVLQIVEVWLLAWIGGLSPSLIAVLYISVIKLVRLVIYVYIAALIIQAILSWVSPGGYGNPVAALLHSLTEPLLRPLRRVIPPVGMLDLTPLVALIGLYALLIVVNNLF
jgi:YggT family protein